MDEVQTAEEVKEETEEIREIEIDNLPNITARIDTIDPLGLMEIIFNASIQIPEVDQLQTIFNQSIIDIYVELAESDLEEDD